MDADSALLTTCNTKLEVQTFLMDMTLELTSTSRNTPQITEVLPSRAIEVERESSNGLGLPVDGRRSSKDVEVQSLLSSGEQEWFLIANTVALFASLVVILLLTSGVTVRGKRMMWVLMAPMWISIFYVAFSFFHGVMIMLQRNLSYPAVKYMIAFLLGCMVLFALLVLLHAFIGLRKICPRLSRWQWFSSNAGFDGLRSEMLSNALGPGSKGRQILHHI
ncbi:hypothetical protein EJ110_NYTH54070 [Nymphaea thermarum]|nr:hypothetical protein EJ110_NYTH54070 [Nymphaea thermarum]